MLENVRLSFQGIWSHKMRSFLTMLGIIIGIASIISIVSTIKGTNEEIKNNLIGSGNNTVEVVLYQNGYTYTIYSESDIPHGIREVTDEVREQIRDLESVENVTCYNERRNTDSIFYLNNEVNGVSIRGIDTDYFSTTGYTVHRGRNFIEDDYKKYLKAKSLLADTEQFICRKLPGQSCTAMMSRKMLLCVRLVWTIWKMRDDRQRIF